GLFVDVSGAAGTNTAAYLRAAGAATNYGLIVAGNGSVGIGTLAPIGRLDINVTSNSAGVRIFPNGTTGNRARLVFVPTNLTDLWNIDNSNGMFRIFREDYNDTTTGNNGVVRFIINDSGNVGI